MKVIIAGGTGLIGRALVDRLVKEKTKVIVLTRNPRLVENFHEGLVQPVWWEGTVSGSISELIEEGDSVVNLAGESLAGGRWTPERKELLLHSRTGPTTAIIRTILRSGKRPRVVVNASAVGYYGNVPNEDVMESYPRGTDFLASLVGEWEACAMEAASLGVRVVLMRNGVVLAKDGGALPRLMLPFRFFLGGWLGSGKQWFPWVHKADMVEIILKVLRDESVSGPVNAVAPESVTMKQFCAALGKSMKRPCWAPVPGFMLRAALGEMANMLLTGQKVIPRILRESGYTFQYPTLDAALSELMSR